MAYEVPPIGESLKGDMAEIYYAFEALKDAFSDDHKCLVRCSHGGACMLPESHDGLHDAEGYCQWGDE